MGEYRRVTFAVLVGLILASVGFAQESFAVQYVKTITIPSYQLMDFLRFNNIQTSEDLEELASQSTTSNTSQTSQSTTSNTSQTSQSLQSINTEIKKVKPSVDLSYTRPTFGLSHNDDRKLVDGGFEFNDKSFSVSDNYHTPFTKQPVKLGESNSFEAKVYAEKKLKVQEFLFGIPEKGEAHQAEMGIEVWYDMFGEIEDVQVVQKTKVIDPDSVVVSHEKSKCTPADSNKKCDSTKVEVVFLEPLKDSIMAIKAIDYKNRYQITYLNDGFDISGTSLNPMATMMIASPEKYEGLLPVTQVSKYSTLWVSDDGRIFEKNRFDSFRQIEIEFERFHDSGEARNRLHSEFADRIKFEGLRATQWFDSSKLVSELPDSFAYTFDDSGVRLDKGMKKKMAEEELKAQIILDQMAENRLILD